MNKLLTSVGCHLLQIPGCCETPCCRCFSFNVKQTLHIHQRVNSNQSVYNWWTNMWCTRMRANVLHPTGICKTFELKQHKFLHSKMNLSLNLMLACDLDLNFPTMELKFIFIRSARLSMLVFEQTWTQQLYWPRWSFQIWQRPIGCKPLLL